MEELEPFLDRRESVTDEDKELWKTICAAAVAVVLGGALAMNLYITYKDIEMSEPHDHYRAGAEWMRSNVTSAQTVFNTDWDDFPRLFYYDPSHNYVAGLDPSYLFEKNPELWKLYERITLGHEEDPGPLIRDRFGARYVFSDNKHDSFFANAMASGWFDIVYEDTECTILRIRDQKGETPLDEGELGDVPSEEPPTNEQP